MSIQTDSRPFLGLGCGLGREWVARKWTTPIAAAVNMPQGSLCGSLLADTNTAPVLYPFVADGTMRANGFVNGGFDNTSGAQGARDVDVLSETGHLVDYNAGGGSAFTNADLYAPVYGVDNKTCSKLSTDGAAVVIIGMFFGLDPDSGEPIVLVDPMIAALIVNINTTGLAHLATTETFTGAKLFQSGNLQLYSSGNTSGHVTTVLTLASTGRNWTIPDATDTAVGKATTDTLTNKTLTAPVINGLTSSGSTDIDFSGNTGAFKTPTGAQTIGGGAAAVGITSSGAAITITAGAASTISTTSGAQTIDGKTGITFKRDGTTIADVGVATSTLLTMAANKGIAYAAGTGTFDLSLSTGALKFGASTATIGFFGTTAASRPSAYTLTYSTASRTSSNITSHAITDSTGGSVSTSALVIQTLPTSPGSGADGTTPNGAQWTAAVTQLTVIKNSITTLAAELVLVKADLLNVKQNAVQAITDLQTLGLLQ